MTQVGFEFKNIYIFKKEIYSERPSQWVLIVLYSGGFSSVFRGDGLPLVACVERVHTSDPACSRSQKGFHSFLSAVIHWCPFKTANEIHPKEGLGEIDTSTRVWRRYNWTVPGVKKCKSYFDWEEKAICHWGFTAFQRYKAGSVVYQGFHMDK